MKLYLEKTEQEIIAEKLVSELFKNDLYGNIDTYQVETFYQNRHLSDKCIVILTMYVDFENIGMENVFEDNFENIYDNYFEIKDIQTDVDIYNLDELQEEIEKNFKNRL